MMRVRLTTATGALAGRRAVVVVVTAAALVTACRSIAPDSPGGAPAGSATPSVSVSGTPAAEPSPPASPAVPPTSTPTATGSAPSAEALRPGDSGVAVRALQERLTALGYWLGTIDGRYGASTEHAVVAFQKATGIARDGVYGPVTGAALDRAARLWPRSTAGRVVEIDLSRQLLLVVADGRVQWVMDASTGSVVGTTPVGRFSVFRQVDAYDPGPLGVLYRPKYFYQGVAVHGYPQVPTYPASHGCVRVTNAAMDWLWANNALPIGGRVWVYDPR
jgi:lipoprotein-anchoring transpeptidase ErfK/SrfK